MILTYIYWILTKTNGRLNVRIRNFIWNIEMTGIRINQRLRCIYCISSIRDMKINLYLFNLKSDFWLFVGTTSTQSTVTDSTTTSTKNTISTGKNNSKKCYPFIILEKLASTTLMAKLLHSILEKITFHFAKWIITLALAKEHI